MKAIFYLEQPPEWTQPLIDSPWLLTVGGRPLIDYWFCAVWDIGIREVVISGVACTPTIHKYLADAEDRWGLTVKWRPDQKLASLITASRSRVLVFDELCLPWISDKWGRPPSRALRSPIRWHAEGTVLHASATPTCKIIPLLAPIAYYEVNIGLARSTHELPSNFAPTNFRPAHDASVADETIVGSDCRVAHGARLDSGVVLGNRVVIDAGSTVRNSVILDNTYIGPNLDICGRIVSGNIVLDPDTGAIVRFRENWMFARLA